MMISDFGDREKQIIEVARSYLGVPFRHQGRGRNGLDCLGLLVCVARDCQLTLKGVPVWEHDKTDYGHFPDEQRLYDGLLHVLAPVNRIHPGLVVLVKSDGAARHLGIVGDYPGGGLSLIHAYAPIRKVVEHRLDQRWQLSVVQCWKLRTDL